MKNSRPILKWIPNWILQWMVTLTLNNKTSPTEIVCLNEGIKFFFTDSFKHQTNYIPICFMAFKMLHEK